MGVPGLVASARMPLFSVFPLSSERMVGTQTRAFTRRDKEAPGETMTDWWEERASLRSGTGETLDSLKPSQAAADQQVTDSGGLSAPTAAGGAEAPGISPVKSLSSLFRLLNAAISPFKACSHLFFFSSPGSPQSPRPVVHTRDVFTPQHAHFSYIVSRFWTRPPCFPPYRAGLEGPIQGDLQL